MKKHRTHPPKRIIVVETYPGVFFPNSSLPAAVNHNIYDPTLLTENCFLIAVPEIPENPPFYIGVLGVANKVSVSKKVTEFQFTGMYRVQILGLIKREINEKVRWIRRREIPIDKENLQKPVFWTVIQHVRHLFDEYIAYLSAMLGEETAERIHKNALVIDAKASLENVEANTISVTIDQIMNVLNYYRIEQGGQRFVILKDSLLILSEENVFERLKKILVLLDGFLGALTVNSGSKNFPGRNDADEIDDDDDYGNGENAPPQQRSKKKKNPRIWISQTRLLAPHHILREALKKNSPKSPMALQEKDDAPPIIDTTLDWKKGSFFTRNTSAALSKNIVGQPLAKSHVARKLVQIRQGTVDPSRPLVGGFLAGPTGVGKTELVKELAYILFGDRTGYTHIACNLLQERHESSLLLGSPPGYIGHDDEPYLAQWRVDRAHFVNYVRESYRGRIARLQKDIEELEAQFLKNVNTDSGARIQKEIRVKDAALRKIFDNAGYQPGQYSSIVLFDEIERAHPRMFDLLLNILDDGRVVLMNGAITDLRNSIVFFTSNVHGKEIMEYLSGAGKIGFYPHQSNKTIQREFETIKWKETLRAIEQHFSFNPAFLGRVGKENLVVCNPLSPNELKEILERLHIPAFNKQLVESNVTLALTFTDLALAYLVDETQDSTNRALGARALKEVFTKRIVEPISILLDQGTQEGGLESGNSAVIDVATVDGEPKITISKK